MYVMMEFSLSVNNDMFKKNKNQLICPFQNGRLACSCTKIAKLFQLAFFLLIVRHLAKATCRIRVLFDNSLLLLIFKSFCILCILSIK